MPFKNRAEIYSSLMRLICQLGRNWSQNSFTRDWLWALPWWNGLRVSITHRAMLLESLTLARAHPFRPGRKIETRLGVIPWSSRLGWGLINLSRKLCYHRNQKQRKFTLSREHFGLSNRTPPSWMGHRYTPKTSWRSETGIFVHCTEVVTLRR